MADGLVQRELSVASDRDNPAKVTILLDVVLHDGHQVPEPRRVHPARCIRRVLHFTNPCSLAVYRLSMYSRRRCTLPSLNSMAKTYRFS
jgi:hypothetical protein